MQDVVHHEKKIWRKLRKNHKIGPIKMKVVIHLSHLVEERRLRKQVCATTSVYDFRERQIPKDNENMTEADSRRLSTQSRPHSTPMRNIKVG